MAARQIQRPTGVGEKLDVHGAERAVLVESGCVAGQKLVPLAGEDHVLVAVGSDTHGASGVARAQGGERGPGVALGFLAAETAAHTWALHDDLVTRDVQHMGHDGLNLRWMLGGRLHEHRAVLARLRPGNLAFQVEMLLTAEGKLAAELPGGARKFCGGVAAPDTVRRGVETFRSYGLGDRQDRRQRLVLHLDRVRREAAFFQRITQHQRDHLTVERNLFVREQNFVLADRADIVLAGYVFGQQDRPYAGHGAGRANVPAHDARAGVGGAGRAMIREDLAVGACRPRSVPNR